MTHALICDGCGQLASDRDPLDDDPTRRWWVLSTGPTPGGGLVGLALPPINLSMDVDEETAERLSTGDDDEDEPHREMHYCSLDCLASGIESLRHAADGDAP